MSRSFSLSPAPLSALYYRTASSSGAAINEMLLNITRSQHKTASAQKRIDEILEPLTQIYSDCQVSNWGGYGELPVSSAAIQDAAQFLFELPPHMQNAEASAENDGSVAIEWRSGPFRSTILSFSGKRKLVHFSSLSGPASVTNGRFVFDKSLPIRVIRLIKDTIEH